MLTFDEAVEVVARERGYQDSAYNPAKTGGSGLTRAQRDLDVAPGILMLNEYVAKAQAAWVNTKGDQLPALQQVAKIAAIAVRILQRANGSEDLLTKGLR